MKTSLVLPALDHLAQPLPEARTGETAPPPPLIIEDAFGPFATSKKTTPHV